MDQHESTPTPQASQSKKVFVGCLIATGVLVLLLGIGGYALYRVAINKFIAMVETEMAPQIKRDIDDSHLPESQKEAAKAAVDHVVLDLKEGRISVWNQKSWIESGRGATKKFVAGLDLPAEQRAGIGEQVDRLADGLIDGTLNEQQLDAITENLMHGPFGAAIAVWGIKLQHVYGSDLDEAGKLDAERQLERVSRGVVDKSITMVEIEAAAEPYTEADPQSGEQKLKEHLTTDELRGLVDAMRKLADEKSIADEPYQIDYAAELKKAIDSATGVGAGAGAAPNAEAEPGAGG